MTVMLCGRCRTPIRHDWLMSWWRCACRTWATDEHQAQAAQ